MLDDGQVIAESELINEYLEDKYPEKPLLPKDAEGRAKVRAFTRFHDLYFEPPMRAVFPKLFGQQLDDKFIQEKITDVNNRLDQLEARRSGVRGHWQCFHIGGLCTCADDVLLDDFPAAIWRQRANRRSAESGSVVGACTESNHLSRKRLVSSKPRWLQ